MKIFLTFKQLSISLSFLTTLGCSHYEVTVNDNLIHSPKGLFQDYRIADKQLERCISEHIRKAGIVYSQQLSKLDCRARNIHSLEGIEGFNALEILLLQDNQLSDIRSLAGLNALRELNLKGNKKLICNSLDQLQSDQLAAPEHCLKVPPLGTQGIAH